MFRLPKLDIDMNTEKQQVHTHKNNNSKHCNHFALILGTTPYVSNNVKELSILKYIHIFKATSILVDINIRYFKISRQENISDNN